MKNNNGIKTRKASLRPFAAVCCAALFAALFTGCASAGNGHIDAPSEVPTAVASEKPGKAEIPVEKVLAVDPGGDNYVVFSSYDIYGGVSAKFDPEKKGSTRELRIGGRDYKLYYTRTRHFNIGDYYYYDYDFEPPEEGYSPHPYWDHTPVGFHPNGALAYIDAWEFDTAPELGIEGDVNADSARAAVERLLRECVDFSKFDSFEHGCRNGVHKLNWFSLKNGVKGGIAAKVYKDGKLLSVDFEDETAEPVEIPDDFDYEPYLAAVEKKARETYGKDGSLEGYSLYHNSIKRIDGREYVFVSVGLELSYLSETLTCQYAVPLE